MAAGIDRFSKEEFEEALDGITWLEWQSLGLQNGQEVYFLSHPKLLVGLMLFSSIDSSGRARDNAQDSIRAAFAEQNEEGEITLIPGKVQAYVTRRANWRINLEKMLKQMASLARWIQPCPVCGERLRLKIKKEDQEVFLFCHNDATNRDTPGYQRHVALTVLDFQTGEELRSVTPQQQQAPKCPTCGTTLRKVDIKRGPNAGKQAWSCPAKDNQGRYLNHTFEVIEEDENSHDTEEETR